MELEKLKKIITEVLNVDESEITMDTKFIDDLGADSLDVYQIIMGVEEELDIEVNSDDLVIVIHDGSSFLSSGRTVSGGIMFSMRR